MSPSWSSPIWTGHSRLDRSQEQVRPELAGTLIGAGRPSVCEDYDLMKAKISALMVSACVVSMPCGKLL
jgi:hypothetical protein